MKTAHDIVNGSGYPLQIYLEEWIRETYRQHRWEVLVREHRWVNAETNDEGYIDLVLEKKEWDLRLVIECKRINGSWTFLLPSKEPIIKSKVMGLMAYHVPTTYAWKELAIEPNSPEAAFCVMETGGQNDTRTLEKMAGGLLLSLEHLAVEETDQFNLFINSLQSPDSVGATRMFYLPIIVTTASLQTIAFDPSSIDVKNGKINENEGTVSAVEYIRFRKNLATTVRKEAAPLETLAHINRSNDRTVLIVQAESFINFLSKIDT